MSFVLLAVGIRSDPVTIVQSKRVSTRQSVSFESNLHVGISTNSSRFPLYNCMIVGFARHPNIAYAIDSGSKSSVGPYWA